MDICINNLNKLDEFATLFQNIKSYTDNINIDFNDERMYIQTMDSSKISILEITIPKSWFCKYNCIVPVTLGVNSSIFFKILSSRDKCQVMHMTYLDSNSDKLYIDMESSTRAVFDRNFEVPLIELCYDVMVIPEKEYQADISLPSNDFSLLINQLRGFGETLQIVCNDTKVEMISKSIDQGKMSVILQIDDLSAYAIEENQELNLSYSLKNLHSMSLFGKTYDTVELKLHSNYPLYICYNSNELTIKLFLAPKVSDYEE